MTHGRYTVIPKTKQLYNGNWIVDIVLEETLTEGSRRYDFFGPMKEETDSFVRSILQLGGVGLASAEHARGVLALTMAADTSCKEGTPISL